MRTDERLASEFAHGDDAALATLYDRYRVPLFTFCSRMLADAESARDVVQDLFAGAYARRDAFGRVRSVRAWLFALARNRCLNELRRARGHARLAPALEAPPAPPATDAVVEAEEAARRVRAALIELAPEHREVLILREYLDLSYDEIAEITDASVSAIKSRLFRARQALSERLRPALSEGGDHAL